MAQQASELLTVMSTAYPVGCRSPCAGRPCSRVAGSRQHVCGRFDSRRCAGVCAAAFAGLHRADDVVPGVGDDGMVRIVVTDVGGADRLRDDPAECGRGAGPAEHTNRSVPATASSPCKVIPATWSSSVNAFTTTAAKSLAPQASTSTSRPQPRHVSPAFPRLSPRSLITGPPSNSQGRADVRVPHRR